MRHSRPPLTHSTTSRPSPRYPCVSPHNYRLPQPKMDAFFRPNRTLIQKLQDTGYAVPADELAATQDAARFATTFPTPASLNRLFMPRPQTVAATRSPQGIAVHFAFHEEGRKTVGVAQVGELLRHLDETGASAGIFVVDRKLSGKAATTVDSKQSLYRISVFTLEELAVNVSRHIRVPRHELLSIPEAAAWLAETSLKRSQLPRIFTDDPQARYLDAFEGDIIRVISPSITVREFPRYFTVERRPASM